MKQDLELFCRDKKTICMKNIPPTVDAMLQYAMQPIKLHVVSVAQVKMHSKKVLHQIPGAGLGMNATRNICVFG